MRIRNTGESLSRPFPRLQRTRQCRGRASHTDFKRRTPKCPSFPYRAASGLPPLFPAATPVSNDPTCWRRPPSCIHRHRHTLNTSAPSPAAPLHVAAITLFLQRGLPTAAPTSRRTQAQSSGRLAARPRSKLRAATQPVRTSNGKRLTTTRLPGLLPTTVSAAAAASPAIYFTSNPPSPFTKLTSQ